MTSGICIRYALKTIKHSLKNSNNSDPHAPQFSWSWPPLAQGSVSSPLHFCLLPPLHVGLWGA